MTREEYEEKRRRLEAKVKQVAVDIEAGEMTMSAAAQALVESSNGVLTAAEAVSSIRAWKEQEANRIIKQWNLAPTFVDDNGKEHAWTDPHEPEWKCTDPDCVGYDGCDGHAIPYWSWLDYFTNFVDANGQDLDVYLTLRYPGSVLDQEVDDEDACEECGSDDCGGYH